MTDKSLDFEFPSAKIISREEWGALPPKSTKPLKIPVYQVGFIATNEPPCTSKEECMLRLRRLQDKHMGELGMSDIAYNFYVCGENLVFEGRGWKTTSDKVNPNHVYMDGQSIDIGYIGIFNRDNPPLSVLETRDNLVSDGIYMRNIHRLSSYFN